MSDADELEEIRQEKLEAMQEHEAEPTPTDDGAPQEPIHVRDADHFQEIVSTHGTVLVDFYADWCGPCKAIEPIVETLATETPAAVAKVDVDAHQQLAQQYQVRGVPTLTLFSDGELVERLTGARQKPELAKLIQQYT